MAKLDDPEVRQIVVDAFAIGLTVTDAARAARVHRATLHSWLALGAQDEPPARGASEPEGIYADRLNRWQLARELAADVEQARGRARWHALAIVRKAMKDDWRAAAWFLERSLPEEWGRQRVEVTGAAGAPPVQVVHTVRPESVEELLADPEVRAIATARVRAQQAAELGTGTATWPPPDTEAS